MSFKIVATALLVVIAAALLVNLACKVRVDTLAESDRRFQSAAKGCCGNKSGGGCSIGK